METAKLRYGEALVRRRPGSFEAERAQLQEVTVKIESLESVTVKTIITFWWPAVAFGISALVGVVFGIYPAVRAAKMDPVEALRHE